MRSLAESLTSWATLISSVISLIAVIQSETRIAEFGVLLIVVCSVALVYAHSARAIVKSARIHIEGRSIDSLNLANLRRRVNRSLYVQEVTREVHIEGADLRISSRYIGYCTTAQETIFEFSVDMDNNVPFAELECFAIDLKRDPDRRHRIRPMLLDSDGNSKKLAVPFLAPLTLNQSFDILLLCKLPECLKTGVEYYSSSLSFDQDDVRRQSVSLTFTGTLPAWVRVYECDAAGQPELLKELQPISRTWNTVQYEDVAERVQARSARIYMFSRDSDRAARAA